MPNNDIQQLVNTLIKLGEDREELEFWISIYPDLEQPFQKELIENLQAEITALENAS